MMVVVTKGVYTMSKNDTSKIVDASCGFERSRFVLCIDPLLNDYLYDSRFKVELFLSARSTTSHWYDVYEKGSLGNSDKWVCHGRYEGQLVDCIYPAIAKNDMRLIYQAYHSFPKMKQLKYFRQYSRLIRFIKFPRPKDRLKLSNNFVKLLEKYLRDYETFDMPPICASILKGLSDFMVVPKNDVNFLITGDRVYALRVDFSRY